MIPLDRRLRLAKGGQSGGETSKQKSRKGAAKRSGHAPASVVLVGGKCHERFAGVSCEKRGELPPHRRGGTFRPDRPQLKATSRACGSDQRVIVRLRIGITTNRAL